jgi:hypothetical protein
MFPDVSHTCERLEPSATATVAPDLVIEVISPESKTRDRSEKLDAYRSISSDMEYVLVDSRRAWACVYRRMPGGVWTDAVYGIDETLDNHAARWATRSTGSAAEASESSQRADDDPERQRAGSDPRHRANVRRFDVRGAQRLGVAACRDEAHQRRAKEERPRWRAGKSVAGEGASGRAGELRFDGRSVGAAHGDVRLVAAGFGRAARSRLHGNDGDRFPPARSRRDPSSRACRTARIGAKRLCVGVVLGPQSSTGAYEEDADDDQHRGDHKGRVRAEPGRARRGQLPTGWATQLRLANTSAISSLRNWSRISATPAASICRRSNSGTAHATRRT